jgi:hypothetical protein
MQGKFPHFFTSFAPGFQDFSAARQQAASTVAHFPHAVAMMRPTIALLKAHSTSARPLSGGDGRQWAKPPVEDGEQAHVQ